MSAQHRQAVADALRRPRYEVIPLQGVAEAVAEHVPTDVQVTVTASPRRGTGPTLDLCERLAAGGYHVTPHLSARLITGPAELREILTRLAAAGIGDVFVIAGDASDPAGAFTGALDLLSAMADLGEPAKETGIAGYPESHPFISDDVTIQSMWDKRRYATYIVSQICFDPGTIHGWVRRVRRRGITLPIHVGVPGPVDPAKLARIATGVGLGESARFLRGHRSWLATLVRPRGYDPTRLVSRLAPTLADPAGGVHGLHIYTFNEVAKTERWRQALLERLQEGVSHDFPE